MHAGLIERIERSTAMVAPWPVLRGLVACWRTASWRPDRQCGEAGILGEIERLAQRPRGEAMWPVIRGDPPSYDSGEVAAQGRAAQAARGQMVRMTRGGKG
jgi:hypothetical protein